MNRGCQTIFYKNGDVAFKGEWDSKILLKTLIKLDQPDYWINKKVLVMASNTSGLCVELARLGAEVISSEPDPYRNTFAKVQHILEKIINNEKLKITFKSNGFFESRDIKEKYDIIVCYGIIYHFRNIFYCLDYLSSLKHTDLFLSTQTHPGNNLAAYNRRDTSVIKSVDFFKNEKLKLSGFHLTRPLLENYLLDLGYSSIKEITDYNINFPKKPMSGLTNSSYYKCTKREEYIDIKKLNETYISR